CYNCGVTKTPLWRRTQDRKHSLCNACGLYFKQYKTNRPIAGRTSTESPGSVNSKATANANIECANCGQTQTPLWRKDAKGQSICNACGLYARLHQRDRPVTMRKTKIARRKR
ncbi:hypothetical protein BCR41DRAFT_294165, partial [Lobosporangium transversale]